jgi:hypothetical protein
VRDGVAQRPLHARGGDPGGERRDAYERSPCGNVDANGSVDVADVFFLINYPFAGGHIPPGLANVNGDSSIDVSDVFFLQLRLRGGGSPSNCPGT